MTSRSWNNGPLGNTPITAAALNGMESDIASAVSSAAASATSAANSANLVGAPADTAIAAAIQGTSTATAAALNAAYGPSAIGTQGSPQRAAIDAAVLDRTGAVGQALGLDIIPSYVPDPGKFDVRRSTYNVNARTMAPWLAALARTLRGGNNAHQVHHGDSITRGAGTSSPYPVTSWTARYRDALQNFWAADEGWNAFNDEASTAADPNTVVTGFTRSGSKGLYQEARVSAANGNTIVISNKTVRKFRILYEIVAGGGSFTYQATGDASATTVDTSAGTPGIGSVTTTANTQTLLRTLTITALGAGVTILAILPIVADTGRVVVTRGARNGATISNLIDTAGGTVSALNLLTYIPADLLVLMMETNDFNQQTALATYKTRMQTAITQQKNAGGAVLLVATIPPGITPTIPLVEYTKVLYQLADENDIGILDMQHRWVSYAVSSVAPFNYYYLTDGTTFHPTDAGAADIAAAVQGAVMPGGWGNRKPLALDTAQAWTAMQKFGYPGSSNEQLAVGGSDLFTDGSTTAPTVAYALANNVGALWLAPKSGQEIFVRGRARMEGTYQFTLAAVTTAQRPTVGLAAGATVFDTTLGKPIWHNGTGWVDATGTTV